MLSISRCALKKRDQTGRLTARTTVHRSFLYCPAFLYVAYLARRLQSLELVPDRAVALLERTRAAFVRHPHRVLEPSADLHTKLSSRAIPHFSCAAVFYQFFQVCISITLFFQLLSTPFLFHIGTVNSCLNCFFSTATSFHSSEPRALAYRKRLTRRRLCNPTTRNSVSISEFVLRPFSSRFPGRVIYMTSPSR